MSAWSLSHGRIRCSRCRADIERGAPVRWVTVHRRPWCHACAAEVLREAVPDDVPALPAAPAAAAAPRPPEAGAPRVPGVLPFGAAVASLVARFRAGDITIADFKKRQSGEGDDA